MYDPNFTRPELLCLPVTPKPLHGMTPRTLKGQSWWDKQRKAAYAANNDCCWACGTHKKAARYRTYLEGHEAYTIDYEAATMTINEIVALCHPCHNFIHSGRLYMNYLQGRQGYEKTSYIFRHGFRVIKDAGLKPFIHQAATYLQFQQVGNHIYHGMTMIEAREAVDMDVIRGQLVERGIEFPKHKPHLWQDWRIVIDGEEFRPEFNNIPEGESYYGV